MKSRSGEKKLRLKTIVTIYILLSIVLIGLIVGVAIFQFKRTISMEAKETGHLLSSTILAYRHYLASIDKDFLKECNFSGPHHSNPFVCAPAYATSHALAALKGNFSVRQVSDHPRNPKNIATGEELKAIQFFREHNTSREFFISHGDKFFYAYPLRVEKSCLKCHGPKKDVPKPIYDEILKYYGDKGFGYHLGDLRGILAIYIPQRKIQEQLTTLEWVGVGMMGIVIFLIGGGIVLWNLFKRDLDQFTTLLPSRPEMVERHFQYIQRSQFRFQELEEIRNNLIQFIKLFIKNKEEKEQSYYRKSLTNLPSLFALYKEIKDTAGKEFNLIVLDVDKFREINQTFGIERGNEVIKEIARKLKAILKRNPELKLYHIDIDKFAIQVPYSWSKEEIKNFTQYLIKQLEGPYDVDGLMIRFRAGIAYHSTKPLLRSSLALDQAKERNRDIVFDDEVDSLLEDYHIHITYLKQLKHALDRDNIVPFYQPIVDRNGKVVKYEALVRMVDQNGKVVPPIYFMPIAKRSRLNGKITQVMVEKVLARFRNLPYGVSINITVDDIENEEVRRFIFKKVKEFPEPERIIFEMVENEYVGNSNYVLSFFKELKRLGCKIYIDDFGSGYANFEYLIRLNADGVKIDGSLIKNILRDKGSEVIVKSVIGFAKEMKMETVAEFVENRAIFEKLKKLGVDYFQGYYFSPPLSYIPEDLDHFDLEEEGEEPRHSKG